MDLSGRADRLISATGKVLDSSFLAKSCTLLYKTKQNGCGPFEKLITNPCKSVWLQQARPRLRPQKLAPLHLPWPPASVALCKGADGLVILRTGTFTFRICSPWALQSPQSICYPTIPCFSTAFSLQPPFSHQYLKLLRSLPSLK